MAVRSDAGHPPTKLMRGRTKENLVDALDILRVLRPKQRRYLRNFTQSKNGRLSTPSRDKDILTLVKVGILTYVGSSFSLTLLGMLAQEEIWQAEQYIADHYPDLH